MPSNSNSRRKLNPTIILAIMSINQLHNNDWVLHWGPLGPSPNPEIQACCSKATGQVGLIAPITLLGYDLALIYYPGFKLHQYLRKIKTPDLNYIAQYPKDNSSSRQLPAWVCPKPKFAQCIEQNFTCVDGENPTRAINGLMVSLCITSAMMLASLRRSKQRVRFAAHLR